MDQLGHSWCLNQTSLEIKLSRGEGGVPFTGLTPPHFCACLKPFSTSYVLVYCMPILPCNLLSHVVKKMLNYNLEHCAYIVYI